MFFSCCVKGSVKNINGWKKEIYYLKTPAMFNAFARKIGIDNLLNRESSELIKNFFSFIITKII